MLEWSPLCAPPLRRLRSWWSERRVKQTWLSDNGTVLNREFKASINHVASFSCSSTSSSWTSKEPVKALTWDMIRESGIFDRNLTPFLIWFILGRSNYCFCFQTPHKHPQACPLPLLPLWQSVSFLWIQKSVLGWCLLIHVHKHPAIPVPDTMALIGRV